MRHSRALVTTYIVGGAVLATILFAVGSGEGSGTAAAPAVAAGRVIAAGDRQAAIRRVYQAYAERSAGAEGGPVEIALDDFRIVAEDDFDDVAFFPDVATLASDWELAAVIDVRIEEGQPGARSVSGPSGGRSRTRRRRISSADRRARSSAPAATASPAAGGSSG